MLQYLIIHSVITLKFRERIKREYVYIEIRSDFHLDRIKAFNLYTVIIYLIIKVRFIYKIII